MSLTRNNPADSKESLPTSSVEMSIVEFKKENQSSNTPIFAAAIAYLLLNRKHLRAAVEKLFGHSEHIHRHFVSIKVFVKRFLQFPLARIELKEHEALNIFLDEIWKPKVLQAFKKTFGEPYSSALNDENIAFVMSQILMVNIEIFAHEEASQSKLKISQSEAKALSMTEPELAETTSNIISPPIQLYKSFLGYSIILPKKKGSSLPRERCFNPDNFLKIPIKPITHTFKHFNQLTNSVLLNVFQFLELNEFPLVLILAKRYRNLINTNLNVIFWRIKFFLNS